jgi:hypothetical protein
MAVKMWIMVFWIVMLYLIDWLWWDETVSQNCSHQQAYCSSPKWYVSIESHGDDDAVWG